MKKFSLDTSTTDDLPETPAYRVWKVYPCGPPDVF